MALASSQHAQSLLLGIAAAMPVTVCPTLWPPNRVRQLTVVLVKHDAVVVLATSVTAAAGVLAVLADAAMAGRHVAALLTVGLEACVCDIQAGATFR